MEVKFISNLRIDEAISKVSLMPNAQIVTWYIGAKGFKESGAKFHKQYLLDPIINLTEAFLWLIDLTAWGAFQGNPSILYKESSCVQLIKECLGDRGDIISSKYLFDLINSEKNFKCIEIIKRILKRPSIYKKSFLHPKIGIQVKDLFGEQNPMFRSISNMDASKAYSAIQYIECVFIIIHIIKFLKSKTYNPQYNIVFILPNDEIDYYHCVESSINEDILSILNANSIFTNTATINIFFISYHYGHHPSHRPYNTPGAIINAKSFDYNMITSYQNGFRREK